MNLNLKISETIENFKKGVLLFLRPSSNSIFNCHNPKGIKLLTPIRFGLSHLRDHKFKHSFQDSLSPFCKRGKREVEIDFHYLLHRSNNSTEQLALMNTIKSIDMSILQKRDSKCERLTFLRYF